MKTMTTLSFQVIALIILPLLVSAQGESSFTYDVHQVYKPLSIDRDALVDAESVGDLHPFYKESWVKSYKSVKVQSIVDGQLKTEVAENSTLTDDQKRIMLASDNGTDISLVVEYMPDNTLSHNDLKVFDFEFMINPDQPATYANGNKSMLQYIHEAAISSIPNQTIEGYELAAVNFTVTSDGSITDVSIKESTSNEAVDLLLTQAICDMPQWKPAHYKDGVRVAQDFVLTVGNMESCVVNLLNVRLDDGIAMK